MGSHCWLRARVECCTVFCGLEPTPGQGYGRAKEAATVSLTALGSGCASPSRAGEGQGKRDREEPEDVLQTCWEPPPQGPGRTPACRQWHM